MGRPLPLVFIYGVIFFPAFDSHVTLFPLLIGFIEFNQLGYPELAVSRNLSLVLDLCLLYFFRNFPLNETRRSWWTVFRKVLDGWHNIS